MLSSCIISSLSWGQFAQVFVGGLLSICQAEKCGWLTQVHESKFNMGWAMPIRNMTILSCGKLTCQKTNASHDTNQRDVIHHREYNANSVSSKYLLELFVRLIGLLLKLEKPCIRLLVCLCCLGFDCNSCSLWCNQVTPFWRWLELFSGFYSQL